jgi:hypothetical protein
MSKPSIAVGRAELMIFLEFPFVGCHVIRSNS